MKRQRINEHDVSKHYALFSWETCDFCNQEFRMESGYKWQNIYDLTRYSCSTCCCSVSHCSDMIGYKHESEMAMMLGEVPPVPPMRTYRSK